MQFSYHPQAGANSLEIEGELYQHLYKSRRTKQAQTLAFRNLKDDILYLYSQEKIQRKGATLKLFKSQHAPFLSKSKAHLILAMIDEKSLQKMLPFLNELGVQKLSLFYADYSQKKERIDQNKLQRILIASSQQCGRSNILELEMLSCLDDVLDLYPQIGVFDFGGEALQNDGLPILIGPEGGLSAKERDKLKNFKTYSTKDKLILRSESACIYVASQLL